MRIFMVVLILVSIMTLAGQAQVLMVNTAADVVDNGDGVLSLREAVAQANNTAGKQQIRFDPAVFHPDSDRTIALGQSLILNDNAGADISGEGAGVYISSASQDTIFLFRLRGGNNRIAFLNMHHAYGAAVLIDSLNPGNNDIGPGNMIHHINGAGVMIVASGNNRIHDNRIWSITYLYIPGFYAFNADAIVLLNNAAGNTVSGNWLWFNDGSGIASYESWNNTFAENYSTKNNFTGLMLWMGQGSNLVNKNRLFDNTVSEMYILGGQNNGNQVLQNALGDSALIPDTLLQLVHQAEVVESGPNPYPAAPPFYERLDRMRKDNRSRIAYLRDQGNAAKHVKAGLPATEALAPDQPAEIYYGGGLEIYGASQNIISGNNFDRYSYGLVINSFYDDTASYYPSENQVMVNLFSNSYDAIQTGECLGTTISENIFRRTGSAVYAYGFAEQQITFGNRLTANDQTILVVTDNIIEEGSGGGSEKTQGGYYGNAAIDVSNIDFLRISGNRISSQYNGIGLYQIGTGHITENTLSDLAYIAVNAYDFDSLFVESNTFSDQGIYTDNYNNVTEYLYIANNFFDRIRNNVFNIYSATEIIIRDNVINSTDNYGMYLYQVNKAWIENNEIRASGQDAFYGYMSDSLWLNGNQFLHSFYDGILVEHSRYFNSVNNDIFASGGSGIYAGSSGEVILQGNDLTLNNSGGISLYYNGNSDIRNNNVLENNGNGIYVYGDTTFNLVNNYIAGNDYGFYSYFLQNRAVKGNTFAGNKEYGVYYDVYQDTLDATGNYWGHPSGPALTDTIYPGYTHGDRIIGNVRYDPWLGAPAFQAMVYPVIDHLEPAESPREGGSPFSVVGRQMLPGAMIYIEGTPAGETFFAGSDRILSIIPPGPGGWVDVIMVNPGGNADTLINGFFYENNAPLPFDLIFPDDGSTVSDPKPVFRWRRAPDTDGDPVEYVLMYSKYENFQDSLYEDGISDTIFSLSTDLEKNSTYYWRVLARDGLRGGNTLSETRMFTTDALSSVIADGNQLLRAFALHQNFPNPFNPTTRISYDLKSGAEVQLIMYNMLGQKVATLVDGRQPAGRYSREFDGSGLASGIYFYRIVISSAEESFTANRKMVLIK